MRTFGPCPLLMNSWWRDFILEYRQNAGRLLGARGLLVRVRGRRCQGSRVGLELLWLVLGSG